MAIGSTTQWGSRTALAEVYAKGFVEGVFRNGMFLPLFGTPIPSRGGTSYRWKVNSSGNTSTETYTESASQPTPVAQTYVNADLAYVYFRAMVRYTGHARDAAKLDGLFPGLNPLDEEFRLGRKDLIDLMNTTFLGSSNGGLEVAVDDGTTYAGISRSGTVNHWDSFENALSGVLTQAALLNIREAVRDNERGGRVNVFLMPWNQITNLQSLPGAPGASNNSLRFDLTQSGGRLQIAPNHDGTMFGEAAVIGIADMLDTLVVGLDTSSWLVVEHRPFNIREDISGDDDVFQLSWAGALVCKEPKNQGKQTGVTA